MTSRDFFNGLSGQKNDFELAAQALASCGEPFCLIGGLAVNHYAEPMVTLDVDFAAAGAATVARALTAKGFRVEEHTHSINARYPGSDLRVRITINSRYREFPSRAVSGEIFGVRLPIAALPDLVQGKLWALQDATRRASKRAKDRADLIRICEQHPEMISLIPPGLVSEVDEIRSPH